MSPSSDEAVEADIVDDCRMADRGYRESGAARAIVEWPCNPSLGIFELNTREDGVTLKTPLRIAEGGKRFVFSLADECELQT